MAYRISQKRLCSMYVISIEFMFMSKGHVLMFIKMPKKTYIIFRSFLCSVYAWVFSLVYNMLIVSPTVPWGPTCSEDYNFRENKKMVIGNKVKRRCEYVKNSAENEIFCAKELRSHILHGIFFEISQFLIA